MNDPIMDAYKNLITSLEIGNATIRLETIDECVRALETFDGKTAAECAALLRLLKERK
jgi:hypothetical protein